MRPIAHPVLTMLICAACGGGGGGGSSGRADVDPRLARLEAYEAQNFAVLGDPAQGLAGLPITLPEDVPTTGAATFLGNASIRVEDGAAPLALFGDATFSADFETGAGTGRLDRFFGTDSAGEVRDYGGEISLVTDGLAQNTTVLYAGTLAGGNATLAFDGAMDLLFLGDDAAALVASDLDATIAKNGEAQSGTIVVVATQEE